MLVYKKPGDEPPCKKACPAGIDIPRYVRYISWGKFDEALSVIREKNPFPSVCGRVCFAPCEKNCRLNAENGAVAIKMLKRFVAEREPKAKFPERPVAEFTGRRIAIVGSGPTGLTCAYYLAKVGHSVIVFERLEEPGGMMRMGISESRLPRKVLEQDINYIKAVGVEIKTGIKTSSLADLFEDGFEAVFLDIGAYRNVKSMEIAENDLFPQNLGIRMNAEGNLEIDSETTTRNRKGVFAGGPATRLAFVIKAIEEGRKVAIQIEKYLEPEGIIDEKLVPPEELVMDPMQEIPVGKKIVAGLPVEPRYPADKKHGYDEKTAMMEAKRCLRCDLPIIADPAKCVGCLLCTLRCSFKEGSFNPLKAKIRIDRAGKSRYERRISFATDCDNCHFCVNICPYGALSTSLLVEGGN